MNIFERASRAKLLFQSPKGLLTTDQLWDLPLTHNNAANLDSMARAVNRDLKSLTEESFVEVTPDPRRITLELQLDILKHIIESKKVEQARAIKAAENKQRRERLLEVLANKENESLTKMSKEEIEAELAKL